MALLARALIDVKQDNFDAANDICKDLVSREPSDTTYTICAIVAEKSKDYAHALAYRSEALRLKPTSETYSNRSELLSKLEDYDSAIADANEAIKTAPEEPGRLREARPGPLRARAITTKPSPISPARSGSSPITPCTPIRDVEALMQRRAISHAPSRTSTLPSSSTRKIGPPSSSARTPSGTAAITTAP